MGIHDLDSSVTMLHSSGPQKLARRWTGPIRVPIGDFLHGFEKTEGLFSPKISSYEYDSFVFYFATWGDRLYNNKAKKMQTEVRV